MGTRIPMADAYMVPTAAYQGYVPMGQGMVMEPSMQMASMQMPATQMQGLPTQAAPQFTGANPAQGTDQLISSDSSVPGTLGMTYQRPTKRNPADIHPRIGRIEINVSDETFRSLAAGEEIKITVEDEAGYFEELEGYFGDDDKWHFESKPLYPGIPQIYDAKFEVVKTEMKKERKGDRIVEWEVEKKVRELGYRRMRLIPGRTVFMEYP